MQSDLFTLYVLTALGVVQLFFGYRLFRLLLIVSGLIFGFRFGPELYSTLILAAPGRDAALWTALLGAALLGICAYLFFRAAVFLWGALLGYLLGLIAFGGLVLSTVLIAVAVGIVVVLFERVLIAGLFSLTGAWWVVAGAGSLLGYLPAQPGLFFSFPSVPPSLRMEIVLITAFLACLGFFLQLRTQREPLPDEHVEAIPDSPSGS